MQEPAKGIEHNESANAVRVEPRGRSLGCSAVSNCAAATTGTSGTKQKIGKSDRWHLTSLLPREC